MKLVFVLLALAALAFASGTITGQAGGVADYAPPATDSTLDSYAYNAAEQMSTIGASFDDYAAVDDYNGISSSIDTYTAWGVTTASAPTALEIMVVADDSGGTTVSGSKAYRTLDAGWSWEPFSYSLVEGDLFKIIVGPPYSSLNRSTWAEVKS